MGLENFFPIPLFIFVLFYSQGRYNIEIKLYRRTDILSLPSSYNY